MQAANMADNNLIVIFHPQEKKPSGRALVKTHGLIRFSEALAKCKPQDDIVASLCEVMRLPASYVAIGKTWPWLKKRVEVPCGCGIAYPSVLITLCHIYDRHVLDLKDWSLSELVEWTTRTQSQME